MPRYNSVNDLPEHLRDQVWEHDETQREWRKRVEARPQENRTRPLLIVLPGERPKSLNDYYSGQHWRARKKEADRVHELVRSYLDGQCLYSEPVSIRVTAYFGSHPQDASNIMAKLYEDALIDWVIVDDGPKHVRSVTTESRIDKDNPRVEIRVEVDNG